ncbi:helix-turn-helix domain-containing protein [uncultured Rikenella sp.]|uniref:helix-turn-helix domain-containing protein n=1 Tax=uncultured Rikenella sp. TaxID=368003 RepID=UPI00272B4C46|nr:cupin domain-containing protein [uncultured Rikenella sp.]
MLAIIGQIIRQLREENGITIEEFSERAGIDADKLAKIENNQANPSLGILIRLSRAMGAKLGTLWGGKGEEERAAVVARKSEVENHPAFVGNEAERSGHLAFYALAQGKADRHMEPLIVDVLPGRMNSSATAQLRSEHSGEEFLYVLDGEVTLYYGDEIHRLEAGDSIYYNSVVPHFLANETAAPARVLAMLYTPY